MNDHTNVNNRNPATTLAGLTYLLIGGGIGAATALLFAPKSGSDMRHDISDATRKGYDGTRDLAKRVKEQSVGLFRNALDRVKTFEDAANEILELETAQNKNNSRSASNDVGLTLPAGSDTKAREFGRKNSAII